MATTLFTATRKVNSRGSYWGSREPYYTFKFEVILNSQNDNAMTSSITMNAYLACNDSATSNRWSSSSYYAGFTQVYDDTTTQLSSNNHSSWGGAGTNVFKKFESYTKTYTHDADGHLDLELIFKGTSSSSLKYLPENITISTGTLDIPDIDVGKVYGKRNGTYTRGQCYVKAGGVWHKGKRVYAKKNGEWKIGK